jgi:hypothetical protein
MPYPRHLLIGIIIEKVNLGAVFTVVWTMSDCTL